MGRSRHHAWFGGTVLAASLWNVTDLQQLSQNLHAEDRATDVIAADPDKAPPKPAQPAPPDAKTPPAADPAAPAADPNTKPAADAVSAEDDATTALKESVIAALRQVPGVCGVVIGNVTDTAFPVTVLVEESAQKQPTVEQLTPKIRKLCGEREVLETKPWAAATRLKELQVVIKEQAQERAELAGVKLSSLFLKGLVPDEIECELQGAANQPRARKAVVEAVSQLVSNFETPVGNPGVSVDLDIPFDPAPLLKALQDAVATRADLSGVKIDRIGATQVPGQLLWQLEIQGSSPLPLPESADSGKKSDRENLKELGDNLLSTVYPLWINQDDPAKPFLQLQAPDLMDRVPDSVPVLTRMQELLKGGREWQGCMLTAIEVVPPAEVGTQVVWKLKGKVEHPLQQAELVTLCQNVTLEVHPWWKRAKDRLEVQSACAINFPSPEPLVKHVQGLLKTAPEWRGCVLKGIEATATGGDANADGSAPSGMIWTLVGDVYHAGQKKRLMTLVQEENCRINPAWKNYPGLQFSEQLQQVPVDPAPVLKVLQKELTAGTGWSGCRVTGLEAPPCDTRQVDNQTWEIVGTVAFASQRRALQNLANQSVLVVYPGLVKEDGSPLVTIDPNPQVQIVHPTAATLLALIQHDLERMPEFDDCHILDAKILPGKNAEEALTRLDLRLIGRTTRAAHLQTLTSLEPYPSLKEHYGQQITKDDIAITVGDAVPVVSDQTNAVADHPTDVELLPLSPGLAVLQFELGQNHYVRNEFAQAKAAFVGAMFDDVTNLNYKYWHVAMCLALGEESLAHDRLYNIMKPQRPEFRNSDAYRSAMRSLERLQGPLRSQLEAVERQVLTEIAIKTAQTR